jgi:hypothetical protein
MTYKTILRGPLVLLLAALVLSAGARAQDCDFEFEDVCVELPNGIPTPGRALSVVVTVSGPVPGDGRLFYRPTGGGSYAEIVPAQAGNRYSVSVPAEAVTVRGLDVYGSYLSADGEEFFYPEENPVEDPIHVPVYIGSFTIPVELQAREYRMISVAANVGTASVVDVLEDDFGVQDVARWRLIRWNPATNSYDELPNVTNSFSDGAAFWIITADGGTFDIDVSESTNPDSLPAITLAPGLNQIGNPYAFPVAWDAVRGARAIGSLLEFVPENNSYREATTLEPWTGYFVENFEGTAVSLAVPDQESVGGAAQGPETSYAVRVEARAGEYVDSNNVVGFAAAATPGHDRLDLGEPPPIGAHVGVSVVEQGRRAMRSLKPPSADGAMWDLEVTATAGLLDDGPRQVSLTLREEDVRPAGFDLYVIDRDRGTAVALTDGALDLTLSAEQPVRRLRLIAGTEAFASAESEGAPLSPTAFALAPGYPNPFAAQTTISYQLEERGAATLEVFDLLGRRVRVLAEGEQSAGSHTIAWDGRDAAGRPVANGVYLVRLRTGDASATRRVSVLR